MESEEPLLNAEDVAGEESLDESGEEPRFAPDPPPEAAPTLGLDVASDRGRQGADGRPYCSVHICLMTAGHSDRRATHYACPVPGCKEKEKKTRPMARIPSQPQRCPNRICEKKPDAYLAVVPKKSTVVRLTMRCPCCGMEVHRPRPEAASVLKRQQADADRRAAAPDLAAR
jgi:hypothetical protein